MSFRLKTILGVALIEAVLLSFLLYSGLRFISNTAESEFSQRAQATVKAFSVAAKGALISSDLAALDSLAHEMLTYPGVVYTRIRDVNSIELAAAGQLEAARHGEQLNSANPITNGTFHAQAMITEASSSFGKVEIGLSVASLQAQQVEARNRGLLLAGLEMGLVALFSWFLGNYLTRQLRALKQASEAVGRGEFQHSIPVTSNDELGETSKAFNAMSSHLGKTYSALERKEQDMRLVLNATTAGFIVVDQSGVVQSYNHGAHQMLGWDASEVLGNHIRNYIPLPVDFLEQAALPEREMEVTCKSGARLWAVLRISELQLEGTSRRFLYALHDISAAKETEWALRQAKLAAEQTAQTKSEFLANMSHEIRTPLHGVLASIEMLGDTNVDSQQDRMLRTARTSAELLLGVIDEILDFSRLEAGKLRIESMEFDLRRAIEDVCSLLAAHAHAKKVEFALYIDQDVPSRVISDPIRLRQILSNLLGNAIKFTDKGEVVTSVTVSNDDDQLQLRLEIQDTGIGIEAEKLNSLFQPFVQADTSTSRRFGGTGLGLSIVKHLVALMGGTVNVESSPGLGSKFWVILPITPASSSAQVSAESSLAGLRMLVVDDNSTNRIILHRYINNWGGESGSATNGPEALAMLQDAYNCGRPYGLLLLDLNMPGMDGYELLAHIQSDPQLKDTPAIMLSSSMQDPGRLEKVSIDVWLDKPVRQSDLHDAIATVLARIAPAKNKISPVLDQTNASPETPEPTRMFSKEVILLVEDNPITRDLGIHMLRKLNLQVETAETGVEAIEAIRLKRFDAVLMDIQMPVMDGLEATRRIRQHELESGRMRTPIIALTAHAQPSDKARCMASGMDDYVTKPYSAAQLGQVLDHWIAAPDGEKTSTTQRTEDVQNLANATSPTLDAQRLRMLSDVMGSNAASILIQAATLMQAQLQEMQAALSDSTLQAAAEVAHRLKNTAGEIGAMVLHKHVSDMETQLRAGRLDTAAASQLAPMVQRAADAVSSYVDTLQTNS